MISFCKTYPNFFIYNSEKILGETKFSLINIHNYLNNSIFNITNKSDFGKISDYLISFKNQFLNSNSHFYEVFTKKTSKINLNNLFDKLEFQNFGTTTSYLLKIPHVYFMYILSEIKLNLRHRDSGKPIEIKYSETEDFLIIEINNYIPQDKEAFYTEYNPKNIGSGNGNEFLNQLSNYPNGYLKYKSGKIQENKFFQELKIKIELRKWN